MQPFSVTAFQGTQRRKIKGPPWTQLDSCQKFKLRGYLKESDNVYIFNFKYYASPSVAFFNGFTL